MPSDRAKLEQVINVMLIASVLHTVALLLREWLQQKSVASMLMLLFLLLAVGTTVHDLGRVWYMQRWDGVGFAVQPYIGVVFCIGLLIAFGGRSTRAFGALENMNIELATWVEDARADLAASEQRRRELEVERAIENERMRIMREVHDGIGSNLVSALTIAERQQHPEHSVRTLRRALSDLKMTVDSLEPMHGDIVALVGNFRHRVEPNLADAGIASRWQAKPCPTLPWLDSVNALHVLRSLQEAMANVLMHSSATAVTIGCEPSEHGVREGVRIYVSDNGVGLQANAEPAGRGLVSMRARMQSIGAGFAIGNSASGATISFWLPLVRPVVAGPGDIALN
jgi:signal transduction histidine kinase